MASWSESVAALIETSVPHASVYMLEVDEDSRLGRELLSGGTRYHAGLIPNDDTIARMYEFGIETLAQAGLEQYEISNFAQPGRESRHNLRYWRRRPYLGVGLDASSALCAARPVETRGPRPVMRATTTDDLPAYLTGPQPAEITWLSPARQHEEAWFLGLRLNAGVRAADVSSEFGSALVDRVLPVIENAATRGLLDHDGDHVRLTPRGRLLSNEVFQQFVDTEAEPAAPGQ